MRITRIQQSYDFPGFKALAGVREYVGNPGAVIVTLKRTWEKKDRNARHAVPARPTGTTGAENWSGISTVVPCGYTLISRFDASSAKGAAW